MKADCQECLTEKGAVSLVTHTISIVELLWTLFTFVGLIFNAKQLRSAVGDFIELRRRRINSIREYAATTTVYMFTTWTLVQGMMVGVGVLAMTVPSPGARVQPTSYAISAAFIGVSAMLGIGGYVMDKRRSALIDKINDLEGGFEHES